MFKALPVRVDSVTNMRYFDADDIGMYGPHTKPNRADRRKAGIRNPLWLIEQYRDMLEELQLEEGYASEPSLEALGTQDRD